MYHKKYGSTSLYETLYELLGTSLKVLKFLSKYSFNSKIAAKFPLL